MTSITHEEVERIAQVARAMCKARGLDPDERVSGGVTSFGPHGYHGAVSIPLVLIYGERWRTFYYPALDAITAVRTLLLEKES